MSSYINFKNYGYTPMVPNSANPPLTQQSSIYALTFDELNNTFGGNRKNFGSMNIDELLKNIWTLEEAQALTTNSNFSLKNNGSLSLPRTLSKKRVDEVWRDLLKENDGFKDVEFTKEPALGEMTLEEFFQRSGVVSEIQPNMRGPNDFIFGFENPNRNKNDEKASIIGKCDNSSSPPSYAYGQGGVRERKVSGILDKVVERRRKRMIKNRESAARSRARKQAYTLELEAEVEKLKELNHELQKKHEEIMEFQNSQVPAKMKSLWGSKRLCLRRTLTGPW